MLRRFLRNASSSSDNNNNNNNNNTASLPSNNRQSSVSSEGGGESGGGSTFSLSPSSLLSGSLRSQQSSASTSWKAHEKLKDVVSNTMKVEELMSFDACIEAANALATSGKEDCSVLVSADGELLIVPQQQQQQQQQETPPSASKRRTPSTVSSKQKSPSTSPNASTYNNHSGKTLLPTN